MDQFRRIQTGKKGDVFMILFKDKKILDDTVLDEIRSEVNQFLGKASGPDVLLDFSEVDFMSSAMLGLLGGRRGGLGGGGRSVALGAWSLHGRLRVTRLWVRAGGGLRRLLNS